MCHVGSNDIQAHLAFAGSNLLVGGGSFKATLLGTGNDGFPLGVALGGSCLAGSSLGKVDGLVEKLGLFGRNCTCLTGVGAAKLAVLFIDGALRDGRVSLNRNKRNDNVVNQTADHSTKFGITTITARTSKVASGFDEIPEKLAVGDIIFGDLRDGVGNAADVKNVLGSSERKVVFDIIRQEAVKARGEFTSPASSFSTDALEVRIGIVLDAGV
mmetsp:Transcript_7262/g.11165  ORF Transcript_7262/g.11165 Transcript_7262/m.11165 type:complete len:214 (-) Transcript_7262:51-692(-)